MECVDGRECKGGVGEGLYGVCVCVWCVCVCSGLGLVYCVR